MTTETDFPRHRDTVSPGTSPLAGTGTMIRFALRRDRIRLPAWIAAHGLLVLYIGSALPQLAPTKEDLAGITSLLSQPVGRMFTGPAFGMDDVSYERFFAAGYVPYLFNLAALMNIMLVLRHTRKEEQTGRAGLIRASVTGQHTALTATLIVAVLTNIAAGALVTLLAIAVEFAVVGSVLVGFATALTGLAFAGVAFVLRALGDMIAVGGSALSWTSPLGWAGQTAPYVHNRWGPLLLLAGFAVVTIAVAFALQHRRDFGASLLPPRPGSARAAPSLGHPLGLAVRLQRGGLLGWGSGILALGFIDGLFTQAMLDADEDMPPQLSAIFGSAQLLDGYIGFLGAFISILVAAYVVYAMQTLKAEEDTGRADAGVTAEGKLVASVLLAHLAVVPASLAVLGLCAALFGVLPRLVAPIGWLLVALIGIVELFAELLDLPDWVRMLSPMWHLAAVPVEEFETAPSLVLIGVTLVVLVLGLAGFRRRQVNVV